MAFSDTCCNFWGRERNELQCIYKTPPTYEHVQAKQWWWHIDTSLLQSVLGTCNLHLCYSCSSATLKHNIPHPTIQPCGLHHNTSVGLSQLVSSGQFQHQYQQQWQSNRLNTNINCAWISTRRSQYLTLLQHHA